MEKIVRTNIRSDTLVSNLLKMMDLDFEREKKFAGMRSEKGCYRIEFFVPKIQLVIEIDGSHHFKEAGCCSKKHAQEKDLAKMQYVLDVKKYRVLRMDTALAKNTEQFKYFFVQQMKRYENDENCPRCLFAHGSKNRVYDKYLKDWDREVERITIPVQ